MTNTWVSAIHFLKKFVIVTAFKNQNLDLFPGVHVSENESEMRRKNYVKSLSLIDMRLNIWYIHKVKLLFFYLIFNDT